MSLYGKLKKGLYQWLTHEPKTSEVMPYDYKRLKYEIRPGDVLLIEGRSRVSSIIRRVTQSSWTHAALYIGRQIDFEDDELQSIVAKRIDKKPNRRLVIEGMLDKGTIVSTLSTYRNHHIRICRPIGIAPDDLQKVVAYAVRSLGQPYNVRHLLDLMRFMLPWGLLPRRWGSTLFRTASGEPESDICSSLIAKAFSSVQFPILPYIKMNGDESMEVFHRNPHLYSPKDFDFSPYFNIIKYPLFNPEEPLPYYRRLPWTQSDLQHQDEGILSSPKKKKTPKDTDSA
jgi:hypothetical protein